MTSISMPGSSACQHVSPTCPISQHIHELLSFLFIAPFHPPLHVVSGFCFVRTLLRHHVLQLESPWSMAADFHQPFSFSHQSVWLGTQQLHGCRLCTAERWQGAGAGLCMQAAMHSMSQGCSFVTGCVSITPGQFATQVWRLATSQ